MTPGQNSRSHFPAILAGLLLALMAVLSGGAALRESVTIDEVAHIGAGVSYLQQLDLRMNGEHPPLPKILAALPLVLRGVRADYSHISWTYAEKFFQSSLCEWVFGEWLLEKWNNPRAILAWARLPMLLLTLVLGWLVYACARRLGGSWAGVLCLSIYASAPVFLAFGPLVHTDIAATLFTLVTLWTFAEVWKDPSPGSVLRFALSLAAALLSKFTAGILFFVFPVVVLTLRWLPIPGQPQAKPELRTWRRFRWRATLKGIFWAALIVYAFYFLFSWRQPTTFLEHIGTGTVALILRRLLFPIALYFGGVAWVLLTGIRATFVLGHAHPHGVWFYFPVIFFLKTPIGFLALLLLSSLIAGVRKAQRLPDNPVIPSEFAMHWQVLWVGLVVFTAACMQSPLNLSIRHFSVPIVLMTLMLAPLPRLLGELRKKSRAGGTLVSATAALLAASCLFTAVRAYPFYFPYVNALSFGHPNFTLFNDSNVDWNQSLPEVKLFAEQHALSKIRLSEYGFADATVWVPQAQSWNCQRPAPDDAGQWAIVSGSMILDGHNCAWLTQYQLEPLAGGSMYALRLPTPLSAAGSPGGPPLPADFRYIGGFLMDSSTFFKHVYEHPEDIPATFDWMTSLMTAWRKANGPPKEIPRFPWEH